MHLLTSCHSRVVNNYSSPIMYFCFINYISRDILMHADPSDELTEFLSRWPCMTAVLRKGDSGRGTMMSSESL